MAVEVGIHWFGFTAKAELGIQLAYKLKAGEKLEGKFGPIGVGVDVQDGPSVAKQIGGRFVERFLDWARLPSFANGLPVP
jgi:hypothetical protein